MCTDFSLASHRFTLRWFTHVAERESRGVSGSVGPESRRRIILPSEDLSWRKKKRVEDEAVATADASYWPVYLFCLQNYPLVRFWQMASRPPNGCAWAAGRNHQSRDVFLVNITYDFHGARARSGTLPVLKREKNFRSIISEKVI